MAWRSSQVCQVGCWIEFNGTKENHLFSPNPDFRTWPASVPLQLARTERLAGCSSLHGVFCPCWRLSSERARRSQTITRLAKGTFKPGNPKSITSLFQFYSLILRPLWTLPVIWLHLQRHCMKQILNKYWDPSWRLWASWKARSWKHLMQLQRVARGKSRIFPSVDPSTAPMTPGWKWPMNWGPSKMPLTSKAPILSDL